MSVFAHKNDKSKFNLGNESDLTGIGDGTAFGAIKAIMSDLSDKQDKATALISEAGSSNKTFRQCLNSLYSTVWANRAKRMELRIDYNGSTYIFHEVDVNGNANSIMFSRSTIAGGGAVIEEIVLRESSSYLSVSLIPPSTVSYNDNSTNTTNGYIFVVYTTE